MSHRYVNNSTCTSIKVLLENSLKCALPDSFLCRKRTYAAALASLSSKCLQPLSIAMTPPTMLLFRHYVSTITQLKTRVPPNQENVWYFQTEHTWVRWLGDHLHKLWNSTDSRLWPRLQRRRTVQAFLCGGLFRFSSTTRNTGARQQRVLSWPVRHSLRHSKPTTQSGWIRVQPTEPPKC